MISIIVTGATGLVGAEVIRQAILDKNVKKITALARRPLDIHHPKVKTIIHDDFLNYSKLSTELKKYDACIWALGVSQTQVNEQEYEVITHDYAIAAARAMKKANPSMKFLFVSGEGAHANSSTIFGRVKWKTEQSLRKIVKELYIVHPAGIEPINQNPRAPFLYKLVNPLYPLVRWVAPQYVISSVQVAKALLFLAHNGGGKPLFRNQELKEMS